MKKILTKVISFAIVLSVLSTCVFASNPSDGVTLAGMSSNGTKYTDFSLSIGAGSTSASKIFSSGQYLRWVSASVVSPVGTTIFEISPVTSGFSASTSTSGASVSYTISGSTATVTVVRSSSSSNELVDVSFDSFIYFCFCFWLLFFVFRLYS